MKSMTLAFLAVSALVALGMGGCGAAPEPPKDKDPHSQTRKASHPEPAAPAQDPKELEFRAAVRAFVAEAQSMGRLAKLTPIDETVFRAKYTAAVDLLTRIPSPPLGRADLEAINDDVAEIYKQIVSEKEILETRRESAHFVGGAYAYDPRLDAAFAIGGNLIELKANSIQRRLEQPRESQ